MPVHHLGPRGTFSEAAAQAFGTDLVPEPSFDALAMAIDGDHVGVLPYYNLLEGLVQEPIDLIFERRLHVNGAVRVPVTFAAGGEGEPIRSHPKALAQCSDWIAGRRTEAAASTADAAKLAATAGGTALAARPALEAAGLPVTHDDVGNRRGGRANFTDFLLVADQPGTLRPGDYRTLLAITPAEERPGLLADLLAQFAFHRLNIAKIHSRPAFGTTDESDGIEPQMFYLEVMCRPDAEPFVRCTEAIRWHFRTSTDAVRLLGGWPALT
ncbi:MAG: prephenate dehydratase domain-containing protein [Planctomycetota bacterium]